MLFIGFERCCGVRRLEEVYNDADVANRCLDDFVLNKKYKHYHRYCKPFEDLASLIIVTRDIRCQLHQTMT